VIRPLGSGGMGTVYLAEDPRLGRFVALKTFAAPDRVLHEARAVAKLSHPNIAGVHDILELPDETVIVFEFVDGETLADRLRRGRLPVVEVIRIGAQIADGLAAAHARGIVHRDLKPGNVMLTREGHAKILDFGLARSLPASEGTTTHTTTESAFAGTPAYAAPEQWLGDPLSPRTDIFALGAVLYEMLGGRRPFEADTRLAIMQLVLEAPRPNIRDLNPHVPPSVAALVGDMLQRDPQQRPATANEVASVLRAIERDTTVSERSDSATVRLPAPPPRRTWGLAIAASVILLAAVAALIVALWRGPANHITATRPVVAVLPLANATGTPTNDYIATGVAESLTTSLAGMSGVTVVSRAAVASAAAQTPELAEIARDLGASYLVEGSVQLSGNRVRLSVNLVRPDRSVVWGDSVEGLFDDIFVLQSRLASAVGRALSVQMSAADRARLAQQPTANANALAAYYRGRALLERRDIQGNIDAALAAFDEAVRLDPNFAVAQGARGEALWAQYMQSKDPASATAAIEAGTLALRLAPTSASARYALAVALMGSGRLDEAIDELQRALAIQPNYDDARRELGNALARKGRVDEALAEFRKAIDVRPNYWEHHSALGVILLRAARYDEAVETFKRVIELQPDNYFGYQQLGAAYQYLGRDEDAVANYERAIAIRPNAQAYSNLGAIYHRRSEYAKAVDAYKSAITLRPNAAATHRNLGDAYARMGRRVEASGAYREAVRLAELELNVNPRDAATMASSALYLAKAGNRRAAEARLREAAQLAPNNVEVAFRGAVMYAVLGEVDRALNSLERAVALGHSRADISGNDEFDILRSSPRYAALLGGGSQR
jgi:serine/threonine-protein kinase